MVENTEEKNLTTGFVLKEFATKQASRTLRTERSRREGQSDSGRSSPKLTAGKKATSTPMGGSRSLCCLHVEPNPIQHRKSHTIPNMELGKPNISHLRIFGSKAFIHIPDSIRRKLDPKGREITFLRYSETSKGYRVLIPETQKVQIVRDIIFDENHKTEERHEPAEPSTLPVHPSTLSVHPSKPSAQDEPTKNNLLPAISMTIVPVHTIEEETGPPLCNHGNELNENNNIEERPTCAIRPYPLRTRKPKVWISMKAAETSENFEPQTYQEAIQSKNPHSWKPEILDEYKSFIENDTWEVVPLPPDRKVIRCKWVFTKKAGHNNTPTRFKARLVAKGYTQKQGIDYNETFAPVVKHDSLRILLSIVASLNLEMIQLDVKTAFLYGVVNEELYLEQPEGFVLAGREKKVCRLKKCLYGLKQAPRVWNQKFNEFLLLFGLSRSIYIRRREEELTLIAIWVDDGLVCSSSAEVIKDVLKHLNTYFEMRALPADCLSEWRSQETVPDANCT
jgi:hypothetical protein